MVTQAERQADLERAHPHVDPGKRRAQSFAEFRHERLRIADLFQLISDPAGTDCRIILGQREDDDSTSGIDLLSWVIIQPDNTVVLRVPQTELGQGVSTTIPQMLAEELELDWEQVKVEPYAPLTVAQFDGGLDGQGNVTCWSCSVASSMAAEQSYGAVRFPFRPENTRFRYKRDMESPVPFGWMRGVGFTQHLWMNFSFLDELRQASGQDPVSFYRGLLDPDHIPQDLEGRELAVGRAERNRRLLDHAVKNGGWNAPILSACVQMPSLPAVSMVEAQIGKPVLTAAIATTWSLLKSLGPSRYLQCRGLSDRLQEPAGHRQRGRRASLPAAFYQWFIDPWFRS